VCVCVCVCVRRGGEREREGEREEAQHTGSTSFHEEMEPLRLPDAASPGRHILFVLFTVMESVRAVRIGCEGEGGEGDGGDGDGDGDGGWLDRIRPKIRPSFGRLPSVAFNNQQSGFPFAAGMGV
jgi:hypothetical protein